MSGPLLILPAPTARPAEAPQCRRGVAASVDRPEGRTRRRGTKACCRPAQAGELLVKLSDRCIAFSDCDQVCRLCRPNRTIFPSFLQCHFSSTADLTSDCRRSPRSALLPCGMSSTSSTPSMDRALSSKTALAKKCRRVPQSNCLPCSPNARLRAQ